jgi:hypothetical protein
MELGNLGFLQNIIENEGDKSLQSLSTEFGRKASREDRAYAVEEQPASHRTRERINPSMA